MDSSEYSEEGPKKTRGITRMDYLVLLTNNYRRLSVELNRTNASIDENGKTLSSYIRVVAHTYVPIYIMDWRAVSKELKDKSGRIFR